MIEGREAEFLWVGKYYAKPVRLFLEAILQQICFQE
jgi:hypothetical protein